MAIVRLILASSLGWLQMPVTVYVENLLMNDVGRAAEDTATAILAIFVLAAV